MQRQLRMLSLCAAFGLAALPQMASGWSKGDTKIGGNAHPKIIKQHGGTIANASIAAYVDEIGRKLVARTAYRNKKWTFTTLDSPVVNAFALPGGYVYVTRGLLALANDEAELAGVIGHEIAHVTQKHSATRRDRSKDANIGVIAGAVLGGILDGKDGLRKGLELSTKVAQGYVAQYSQKQEFEADTVGQRYMIAAGYDPLASAEFLASMGKKAKLEAEIAGREYNPNQVSIFASHPATGARVTRASKIARETELRELLAVREADYMRRIEGMIYGDAAREGFVRSGGFFHPDLRFAFLAPEGFRITNSSKSVVSRGPNGATFTLSSGGTARGSLTDYIRSNWAPGLAKKYKTGTLTNVKSYSNNGLQAARATLPVRINGDNLTAILTVVSHQGRLFHLTGIARNDDRLGLAALSRAANTFRPLSSREAGALRPYRVTSYSVQPGDTVDRLIRGRPYGTRAKERFLMMNGLSSELELRAGDIVKLIAE